MKTKNERVISAIVFLLYSVPFLLILKLHAQSSPYTNQEIIEYLEENEPLLNVPRLSESMIDTARLKSPEIMGSLDFVITFDKQLNLLEVFSPSDPPDYNSAWYFGIEFAQTTLDIIATIYQIAPITMSILDGYESISQVIDFAVWLSNNQDLIAVNKQIRYYIFYRNDGVPDPFTDPTVPRSDNGYLLPPSSLNYGGVYEPADKDLYTVDRIKTLAIESFTYFDQRDDDFLANKNAILEEVTNLLLPMINAYNQYASGMLNDALVFDDYGVYVNNKGDFTINNLILVNERFPFPDQESNPLDFAPGQQSIIQLDEPFADGIDLMEFEIFGANVQLNFQDQIVPFVLGLGIHPDPADQYPEYAPKMTQINFLIIGPDTDADFSYEIDFGDGSSIFMGSDNTGTGNTISGQVNHTFDLPGTYEITFSATNSSYTTLTMTQKVDVLNPVRAGYPLTENSSSAALETVFFTADSSNSVIEGSIFSYQWDFDYDDVNFDVESTSSNPDYSFDTVSDVQKIALIATINENSVAISDMQVQIIQVRNPVHAKYSIIPKSENNTYAAAVGDTVSLTFRALVPPDSSRSETGSLTSFQWSFGDGAQETGSIITHDFIISSNPQDFTVSLTVTDDNNFSNTIAKIIHFGSVGPTYISGGTINNYTEWTDYFSPYIIQGEVTVASSGVLNIYHGTEIQFELNAGLVVNGNLYVQGWESDPIIFTSAQSIKSPGDWGHIKFTSVGSGIIDQAIIQYGGGDTESGSSVYCVGSSPTITNSIIRYSQSFGIRCQGGNTSPMISGNVIESNGSYGIYVFSATPTITNNTFLENNIGVYSQDASPTVTNNTFTGNAGYAAFMWGNLPTSEISGNVGSGNGFNGLGYAGTIGTTEWKINPDLPYILSRGPYPDFGFKVGGTLTVDPGVVIKFEGEHPLIVTGTLVAEGTAASPIIFTSIKDDAYGGDTNNDGNATSPEPGDWGHIKFTSVGSGIIDQALIQYGGGDTESRSSVYCVGSSPTITNSIIRYSQFNGMRCQGGNTSPMISGNVIESNGEYGIEVLYGATPTITNNTVSDNTIGVSSLNASPTITNNTFSGNTSYAAFMRGTLPTSEVSGNEGSGNGFNGLGYAGTIGTTEWKINPDLPYILSRGPYPDFGFKVGGTLTVDPGVVIKFEGEHPLIVTGTLVAEGTAASPIIFTSIKDDAYGGDTNNDGNATSPQPGNWGHIKFMSGGTGIIDQTTIQYGGGDTESRASVYCVGSSPTITNNSIRYSQFSGIRCQGGNTSPMISGNTIESNGEFGIYVYLGATPSITNNTVADNTIGVYSQNSSPTINFNNIINNSSYGVNNLLGSTTIDAENNWWGDASGPLDDSDDRGTGGLYNPDGLGDKVSDYVDYQPWLGTVSEEIEVEVKIFLEGPYNALSDEMTTGLNQGGPIPTTSLYSEDPRTVSSIPADITDWVLVQLRSIFDGSAVASKSAFLHKDGRIVADDGTTGQITMNVADGDYYIVIKHRNHLAVMSTNPVSLSSGSSTLYDFTTGSDKYYGTGGAKELESGVWGMWAGDINQDGQTTTADFTQWFNSARAGDSGYQTTDINLDGQVTTADFTKWFNNARAGAASGVP